MHAETATPEEGTTTWFGDVRIEQGDAAWWRVGLLELRIVHRAREWRIGWWQSDEPDADAAVRAEHDVGPETEDWPGDASVLRFATGDSASPMLRLSPRLADRPIVARPELPFSVMAGEETELYLGTPIWIEVGRPGATPLCEVPCRRLSDTWFGPSTISGELGYATATKARLRAENLPLGPQRALTRVRLVNRASNPLRLERISLPVPNLKLYHDAGSGAFWTQSVTVERDKDGETARVTMGRRPPGLEEAARVAEPRERHNTNVMERALSFLMS